MTSDDFPRYNTAFVAAMFNVSLETIRIWCAEFEAYLSPRANPGHRQKRALTEPDLEVFALIAALKDDGMTYQDVRLALDNGQRGVPPPHPFNSSDALVPQEINRQLIAKIEHLETQIETVVGENERLKQELEQAQRENLRNEVRAEMLQGQLSKTEQRVLELLEERSRLEREMGSMESDLRRRSQDDGD